MRLPVYLDNHATTPLDPRVLDAMMPFFKEHFGNAASNAHEYGWMAAAAVDVARGHVARLIGAESSEIIFTSGATESINLALKGIIEGHRRTSGCAEMHVVTAATEHHAVLDTCKALELAGVRCTVVPVDQFGIAADTVLVSVMWANNEIGTIAPMAEISAVCRAKGVLMHSDATQAVGKIPVDVRAIPVDLLSFSAHKMYGPKGAGALYIRANGTAAHRNDALRTDANGARILLAPQIDGGGHEAGFRSGTLNVPAIVGFGKAARIAAEEMGEESLRIAGLRDLLEDRIRTALPEVQFNGHRLYRLGNNASITFPGRRADSMIMAMKDVAVSTGSACSSAVPAPSHVLAAIGRSVADAKATLRVGLGRFTKEEEVLYAVRRIAEVAGTLSPQPGIPAITDIEGTRA
jgi:cysteine desulfurase